MGPRVSRVSRKNIVVIPVSAKTGEGITRSTYDPDGALHRSSLKKTLNTGCRTRGTGTVLEVKERTGLWNQRLGCYYCTMEN